MKKRSLYALSALLLTASSTVVLAQQRTGEGIYQSLCIACHETGVVNAPKRGDVEAWAPLIEEGQDVLSAHAFLGVRAMPAQGGDTTLTLEEFSDAVAWIVRDSGGDWQTPDAEMMKRIRHEAHERLTDEITAKKALRESLED